MFRDKPKILLKNQKKNFLLFYDFILFVPTSSEKHNSFHCFHLIIQQKKTTAEFIVKSFYDFSHDFSIITVALFHHINYI